MIVMDMPGDDNRDDLNGVMKRNECVTIYFIKILLSCYDKNLLAQTQLHLGMQRACSGLQLLINDFPLRQASSMSFLGFKIDECLNWGDHCDFVSGRLNSLAYLFRSLKSILTTEQLLSMYHGQAESRIRYGLFKKQLKLFLTEKCLYSLEDYYA
ncbi:hypothetical protein NQ315_012951 [Exocentrus adspersus]|uniref:Uncharacterized protein n=1 Tax=Exocentrus adspersus TaxID=1586481 RepID=A0AAV8VSL6_9CUCU|nr:hypothetical protein NQ315_012951 [Exocentrus adspersus]